MPLIVNIENFLGNVKFFLFSAFFLYYPLCENSIHDLLCLSLKNAETRMLAAI